jgi:glutamate-1-semialdehyde 2,1-aminomutase
MRMVAPSGPVYQAGTLSGNPLAMTAGLATLHTLLQPGIFAAIAQTTATLALGVERAALSAGVALQSAHVGSMFGLYFLKESGVAITNYRSAKQYADTDRYARFFHAMLAHGVYIAPSQFEAGFVSAVHTEPDIAATMRAVEEAFSAVAAST